MDKQYRYRQKILGIDVDLVTKEAAKEIFYEIMDSPGFDMIVTPNSEIIENATRDVQLAELISEAALIIPDGIGLVYASKILKYELAERVTGIDFLTEILAYLEENGKSIFLLGSKPENEESKSVAELAGESMLKKFPGLKIAGTHHGYFKSEDEEEIVRLINESGADFVCVALGSPKQEKFMKAHKDEFVKARAGIGVGGSLDVWAGTVKRAPEFYQKHGLEWLYRFVKQPSRWKRVLRLPIFMLKVMASKNK